MESKIQNSERLIKELIANSENARNAAIDESKDDKRKKQGVFQKYKIKDIVFLAIITACTLIGGAVMPLLVNVPLFGIIQLGLGLQFSIFPVIGMMKVRKPGALIFISVFLSAFLIFMFPPMVMIIACAVVAEGVVLLLFRGYKNDWACVTAGTLYMPLTIPLLYLYYNAFYTVNGSEKQAVSMFIGASNVGAIIGISVAVVALCFAGSAIGMLISRELGKAGVLKK
ncbi:MAG: MptD family putative ECF transporter S component [Clostridia bacterium]|nr:MptD family putative ECF transporter S component [Clostridia bacterium]